MSTVPDLGWLGVDVGWVHPAVDSEGQIYRWSSAREVNIAAAGMTRAGDVTIRRADGTTEVQPAAGPQEIADRKARKDPIRIRAIAQRIVTSAAKLHRGIGLENWEDSDLRRGVWVQLQQAIVVVADRRGIPVAVVPAAMTSQTCPDCLHVSPANRPTRDQFRCVECHHEGQADHIAAINIAELASEGGDSVAINLGDVGTHRRSARRELLDILENPNSNLRRLEPHGV